MTIDKIILLTILFGITSTIFPQNLFRSAVLLTHSSGSRLYDYDAYMNTDSTDISVPLEMDGYNTINSYTGSSEVNMVKRWFPDPLGTDWINWLRTIRGEISGDNNNFWAKLDTFNVVIIKGGIQTTQMTGYGNPHDTSGTSVSNKTIETYKWILRELVEAFENHPEKFFSIMTGAACPERFQTTNGARLSHEFATWMKDTLATGNDPVYGTFPSNVYIFDYFHYLADEEGNLKAEYEIPAPAVDFHQNATACDVIAPIFVLEIFDSAIAYESVSGGTNFQFTVNINNGWNMVSAPGLHPTNQNVTTWWSGKDPSAGVFRFSGGYLPVTTTTPGQGYWMKHIGANTYNTGDEYPAGGIQIVTHDPIAAATGWNLIGGYELNVLTSGITTTPAGLQSGSVFQYSGGYTVATNLIPGYGYWIKLTGPGSINIPTSLAKGLAKTEVNASDWGKIIITDKSGKSYTLYTVKGEVNLNDYELPPAPPEGMFDVRFGSGRYAEELSAVNQTIELNSLEYPVSVRVENAGIRLQDGTGNGLNERLKSGEEVTISNSAINKLMVSGDVIPTVYALDQNYPNPFNPSTKIEFSIPEDVNNVTLTIYNALGQRVAELVNSKMEAGKYSYVWNASDVATGLYIYELRTDKFVSVKKMMLLK